MFDVIYLIYGWLFGIPAFFLIVGGLLLVGTQAWQLLSGQSVDLKVVALHEVRKMKRGQERVKYRPEFIVVSGKYAGTRAESGVSSNPALHGVGEIVSGVIAEGTKTIESEQSLVTTLITGLIILAVGFALGLVPVYL